MARWRSNRMLLVLLTIGIMLLAGAFFAFSGRVEGWSRRSDFTDQDADGEPDERNGPARS